MRREFFELENAIKGHHQEEDEMRRAGSGNQITTDSLDWPTNRDLISGERLLCRDILHQYFQFYNNLRMKFDRTDPIATPNPMNSTRTKPVFWRRWVETYFGPLTMALVKKYPLLNPINRISKTNHISFSKSTGKKFLG